MRAFVFLLSGTIERAQKETSSTRVGFYRIKLFSMEMARIRSKKLECPSWKEYEREQIRALLRDSSYKEKIMGVREVAEEEADMEEASRNSSRNGSVAV